MKALIKDNVVIEMAAIEFPVHPSLLWMDAPIGAEIGWILNNGVLEAPVIPVKSTAELLKEYEDALINKLNIVANSKNYDSQYTVISYINSTNATWAAEAAAYNAWRDASWIYALGVKTAVEGGGAAPSVLDFINGIPVIVW